MYSTQPANANRTAGRQHPRSSPASASAEHMQRIARRPGRKRSVNNGNGQARRATAQTTPSPSDERQTGTRPRRTTARGRRHSDNYAETRPAREGGWRTTPTPIPTGTTPTSAMGADQSHAPRHNHPRRAPPIGHEEGKAHPGKARQPRARTHPTPAS